MYIGCPPPEGGLQQQVNQFAVLMNYVNTPLLFAVLHKLAQMTVLSCLRSSVKPTPVVAFSSETIKKQPTNVCKTFIV